MKLLYDLQQSPSDNVSRERLGDRICDMLSCISAHGFCSRLLSLQAVVDTIRDGKWARLEALAKEQKKLADAKKALQDARAAAAEEKKQPGAKKQSGRKHAAAEPPEADDKAAAADEDDECLDDTCGTSNPQGTVLWSHKVKCEAGRRVFAQYGEDPEELWFRGTITAVRRNDVGQWCDVEYDDGESETWKPIRNRMDTAVEAWRPSSD